MTNVKLICTTETRQCGQYIYLIYLFLLQILLRDNCPSSSKSQSVIDSVIFVFIIMKNFLSVTMYRAVVHGIENKPFPVEQTITTYSCYYYTIVCGVFLGFKEA